MHFVKVRPAPVFSEATTFFAIVLWYYFISL
jgi:hypothetical protein